MMNTEEPRPRGRPRKIEIEDVQPIQNEPKKILAKTVQLGLGVDLLGSALSLNSRTGNILEVTPLGIKAISKKTNRVVLVPWANIRAAELYP
jgi:hypothetical protein